MPPLLARLLRVLGLVAYLIVVVVCFVAAGYFSFSRFVRSGSTSTPSVVGLAEAEAASRLTDQGLELVRGEAGRYDPEIPAGHVVLQSPAPRTLVKRGSEVEVILSLGPERIPVPDLADKTLPTAQVTLAATGLALGRTLRVFAAEPTGTIIGQHPGPGAAVEPATSVDVLLAEPATSRTFVMPDLIYRDYTEVRSFFERRGFRFGSVKFERYEGVAPGVILRQFPLAGHPLAERDAVSVVVAAAPEGDDTDLPDLG